MEIFRFASALVFSLTIAQSALAATTVISFDEYPHQTNITTQYQSRGVTASGVVAFDAIYTPWAANTVPQLAITRIGMMTFNIDSAITGPIKTVSAYISGSYATTISAYDAQGAVIARAATEGPTDNELVSITSETNPIAKVTVSETTSGFAIDTLSLSTASVPACGEVTDQLYAAISSLTNSDFKNNPDSRRSKLLGDVERFKTLVAEDKPDFRLRDQLYKLQERSSEWLNATPGKAKVLDLIKQVLAMVDAQRC